jgi:hypothetical protein
MKPAIKRKVMSMEIKFAMKIKEDGKTVQVLLLCTECQGELEMAAGATTVRFRCRKHGELGALTAEELLRVAVSPGESCRTVWSGETGPNEGGTGRADDPVEVVA